MDLVDGITLITKAFEKRDEDKAFQMYLVKYSWMDEESYIPFDEFYNPHKQVGDKTVEEILSDVKETLNTFKGRWIA